MQDDHSGAYLRRVGNRIRPTVAALPTGIESATKKILRCMSDYVARLQRVDVHTQSTLERVLESGQKIRFDASSTVAIQRPNKLRAERTGGLSRQIAVYDGKSLSLFNPDDNYYALADAPETLDELCVRHTRQRVACSCPLWRSGLHS